MQYYNEPDSPRFTKETRHAVKVVTGALILAAGVFFVGMVFGLYLHHVRCACNHVKFEKLKP